VEGDLAGQVRPHRSGALEDRRGPDVPAGRAASASSLCTPSRTSACTKRRRCRAAGHRAEQPRRTGRVQTGLDIGERPLGDRRQQGRVDLLAQQAGDAEQVPDPVVERAQDRADQVPDLAAAGQPGGQLLRHDDRLEEGRSQHPGDGPDVERVAAGPLVHQLDGRRVDRAPRGGRQVGGHPRHRQRAERYELHARKQDQLGDSGRQLGAVAVPGTDQHEQPGPPHLGGQVAQQVERGAVRPVHVLQHDDQAPAAGHPDERVADGAGDHQPHGRGVLGRRRCRRGGSAPAGAGAPAASSTRRQGHSGGTPCSAGQRPQATGTCAVAASATSSSSRRVLPMPAGPVTSTTAPVPPCAAASAARSACRSAARPTTGTVRGAGAVTLAVERLVRHPARSSTGPDRQYCTEDSWAGQAQPA
jgi:hypothetical protein